MKFMARRPITGEWLSRDFEVSGIERTKALSGPSTITAKMDGDLARRIMPDGRAFIEDWGTYVYAVSEDTGRILNHGMVMPPTNYDSETTVVCAGYSSYPKGLIYRHAKFWGPQAFRASTAAVMDDDGVTVLEPAQPMVPSIDRPLTLSIYAELWDYVQEHYSDLGVVLTGNITGGVPIGNNEDPYRLQYWDSPDIGDEMERLAKFTPFDYVEEPAWVDEGAVPEGNPFAAYPATGKRPAQPLWPAGYGSTQHDVRHFLRVGMPRLGRRRDDLRFATGENIVLPPPVSSTDTVNMVLGIGNGDPGPNMAQAFAGVEDGRVKRIGVVTDKTLDPAGITELVNSALRQAQARPKIESIAVVDHKNARLSAFDVGDDIRVQGDHPQYGAVDTWVRIVGTAGGASEYGAVLSVIESSQFTYRGGE